MTEQQKHREREALNALAMMPEHSRRAILGVTVERFIFAYFVGCQPGALSAHEAAARIVALAEAAQPR